MDEIVPFSPIQMEFLLTEWATYNYHVIIGPSGTGKSYIANLKFYTWLVTAPANSIALLVGNTSTSLLKNVILELLKLDAKDKALTYTHNPDIIRVKSSNTTVICIGINNSGEGQINKGQGGSVDMIYWDEISTCYNKMAFDMLDSRLRGANRTTRKMELKPMLATLNPKDKYHWFKTDIIDRIDLLKGKEWFFDRTANPAADDAYFDAFALKYKGRFHDQMVKGVWSDVDEELTIWKEFNEVIHVREFEQPRYTFPTAGLDHGYIDNTCYLLGYYDFAMAKIFILDEILVNRSNTLQIAEKIKAMNAKYYQGKKVRVYSDTNRQLIADLRDLHGLDVMPTRKDDKEAQINHISILLDQAKLIINPRCKNLISQIKVGRWNAKKTEWERTEANSHLDAIDSLIYLVRNIDKRNAIPVVDGYHPELHHVPYGLNVKSSGNSVVDKISKAFKLPQL